MPLCTSCNAEAEEEEAEECWKPRLIKIFPGKIIFLRKFQYYSQSASEKYPQFRATEEREERKKGEKAGRSLEGRKNRKRKRERGRDLETLDFFGNRFR